LLAGPIVATIFVCLIGDGRLQVIWNRCNPVSYE
jgi:hypothetical protein